jgi:acetyl-CoA carboxylase carboxyl transferase subunit beta
VDRVVPERPDAADEPNEFCLRLGRVLGEELAGLLGRDDTERYRSRLHRYRHLGH